MWTGREPGKAKTASCEANGDEPAQTCSRLVLESHGTSAPPVQCGCHLPILCLAKLAATPSARLVSVLIVEDHAVWDLLAVWNVFFSIELAAVRRSCVSCFPDKALSSCAAFSRKKEPSDARSVGEHSCQICFERDHSTAVLPCGHGGMCWDCGLQIFAMTEECPMCRTRIELVRAEFSAFRVLTIAHVRMSYSYPTPCAWALIRVRWTACKVRHLRCAISGSGIFAGLCKDENVSPFPYAGARKHMHSSYYRAAGPCLLRILSPTRRLFGWCF